MPTNVNVIVTCTKRKTATVPDRLRFRCVRRAPIDHKVNLWCERLNSSRVDKVPARQLYSGDHWSIARSIESACSNHAFDVRLWIASAGYGLVSMDTPLRPYSATFSNDHPDSVARKTTVDDRTLVYRQWWKLISEANHLRSSGPRTISEIASDSPGAPLVVIASENYLLAMEQDLRSALSQLTDPNALSIFSAGCKSLNGLSDHLLPYDARMQHAVGGALRSLNMRVAQLGILSCRRSLPTFSNLRRKLTDLQRQQPELTKYDRQAMTDTEVTSFILSELKKNADARHTPLLRRLRDDGYACEQKRFAKLFHDALEQVNGS